MMMMVLLHIFFVTVYYYFFYSRKRKFDYILTEIKITVDRGMESLIEVFVIRA